MEAWLQPWYYRQPQKIKIPKITSIIIPTVTTTITLVLILKTILITTWMTTSSVPPFPLPPTATLTIPLLEKNKNNVMPRFIGHLNWIILGVCKQKRSKLSLTWWSSSSSMMKKKMETKTDQRGKQQFDTSAVLVTKKPSGTVPNRIILCVFTQSGIVSSKDLVGKQQSAKQRLSRFISHPNGIVLRFFKQKTLYRRQEEREPCC